jgi:hypothetical protein
MNIKSLNIFWIFVLLSSSTFATDYIKVNEPSIVNRAKVKIIRGEIFPLVENNKFLFGNETLEINLDRITIENGIDDDLSRSKLDYIKNLDNVNYQIDITNLLNNHDTVKFIKSDNSIIPIINKGIVKINILSCGEVFRIVIPNKPSLIYYSNEIPKPSISNDSQGSINESADKYKKFSNLLFQLGLSLLILLFSGFIFWIIKKYFPNAKKFPVYKIYTEGSFDDFARSFGISRKNLFKMNKNLENYEEFSDNDKLKLKKELKGKELIIGYSKVTAEAPNIAPKQSEESENFGKSNMPPNSESLTIKDFIKELQKTETNIIYKIEILASNKDAAKKIDEQILQIGYLNETITQNKRDKETLTKDINDLEIRQAQTERDYQNCLEENVRFTDKIIFVDFIEPYARIASEYFSLANTGQQKAIEFYERLNNDDSKNTLLIAQLILKFQLNIPIKTGNWDEIICEIKENKTTSNPDLIRSIKNIPTNEEKLKEFKRILFKEVFEKYSSSLLILTEELKNFSKFTDNTDSIIKEYEDYFSKFSQELHKRIKAIDLDLNYVPLFEHYIKYAAYTKLANQSCSSPYKNIYNLEKDTVLEVISYGFGNEETKVILS